MKIFAHTCVLYILYYQIIIYYYAYLEMEKTNILQNLISIIINYSHA